MIRKLLLFAPLAFMLSACSSDDDGNDNTPRYDLRVLTFEDSDCRFSPYTLTGRPDVTIAKWSDLIDSQQFGGPLLYYNFIDNTGYHWCDAGNTMLKGGIIDEGAFWNGGNVISSYFNADFNGADFNRQLEVRTGVAGAAGHNGSRNFCIHNGYVDSQSFMTQLTALEFSDGVARVIDHMYVVTPSYTLDFLKNGDSFNPAAGPDSWVKITATGYGADGVKTSSAEFYLCNGSDNIVTEWTKFDLSGLGEIVKIDFNMDGSADLRGQWGLNFPAYFAMDDIAVRFHKN